MTPPCAVFLLHRITTSQFFRPLPQFISSRARKCRAVLATDPIPCISQLLAEGLKPAAAAEVQVPPGNSCKLCSCRPSVRPKMPRLLLERPLNDILRARMCALTFAAARFIQTRRRRFLPSPLFESSEDVVFQLFSSLFSSLSSSYVLCSDNVMRACEFVAYPICRT